MVKNFLKFILKKILYRPISNYLKKKKLIIIFRRGKAIGDHVYMSSIIKKIYEKNYFKIILFTNYFEFYINNPRIYKLFKIKEKNPIWFLLNLLKSDTILEFRSTFVDNKDKHFLYFHKPRNLHLAQAMSSHFNLDLDYKNLQNEIFFSKDEIESYEKNIHLPVNFALIQSSAKSSYTKNKEWKLDGMQAIVNHFNKINWVQIGHKNEPKLSNCINLLNLNFRELSYVIKKCKFLVTYEGLFNHIASCFNKKNFLIHLGFLPTEAFNYNNNIIIEKNKFLKCYPCFSLNCEFHKQLVLDNFDEEFVIKSIEKNL
tara:strand:- start:67 stop:1008 length:942 start_codon:yes stop_codon:yes gene_type:complete